MKLFIFLISIGVSGLLSAQNAVLSEIADYYNTQHNFNGVVLVATDGKVDFIKAYGVANRSCQSSMGIKSQFKIASVTKVFTAVLIMKLVEEGKIALNGTIGRYFPNYGGPAKDSVTIHQLLTYASGIDNLLESRGMAPYQTKMPIDEFIERFCSGKLITKPGTISNYGNTEYIILHKIIELVSGKSYEDYLAEIILEPLQLNYTAVYNSAEILPDVTGTYTYDEGLKTFKNDLPYFPEMYFGAGSLYSNAEDLATFNHAIFNYKILNKQSTDNLLKINEDLGYTAYGFWGSSGYGNFEEPFYYRTGGILGATANWINTMSSKKTIIVLSNTNASNLYELSEQLYLASVQKPTSFKNSKN